MPAGLCLVATAIACSTASAAAPSISITSPADGGVTGEATPLISGVTELAAEEIPFYSPIVVTIRDDSDPELPPLETETKVWPETSWYLAPPEPLTDGTYTLQASEQRWPGEPALESAPVSFRVDRTPPHPAISTPASGSPIAGAFAASGSAGTAEGDEPAISLEIFSGNPAAQNLVEAVEVQARGGAWSASIPGLSPGSYTLVAQQSDTAGNVGTSAPVQIAVTAPAPPPAPHASFAWFPSDPQVGEPVTLVSSSSDPSSPLVQFSWALAPGGPLHQGTASMTTTFDSVGPHVVRLQVTDAAGASSQVSETIQVRHSPASLMEPFPIVRIAGRETRTGIRLSVLTVNAPVAATVTVRIRGPKGRAKSVSRVATAARGGRASVLLSFPRFARAIPAGSFLEVRVSKAGEIGKLTRLIPHRGGLPTRQDLCLTPGGSPQRCPA